MKRPRSKNVTFRVDAATHRALQALAHNAGEDSVNLYVRRLALAELNEEYRAELLQSLERLHAMGMGIRRDFAKTLEVLLINIAKIPKEQVATFVQQSLLQ